MNTIALLGAGLLGSGMVENLVRKGARVQVWNRTPEKLAPLVALGAVAAPTAADAVRGADRVHLVLAEDTAVDAVIAALRPGLGEGVPVIDHSTNRPERVAERVARLHAEGVRYVSAPVFMSPKDGRDATGMMLIAGPTAEVEALRPALEPMTGKLWHVGERPDLAAAYKLLGNAVFMGMTAIMGDLFAIGGELQLPPEAVLGLFENFKPGAALPFFGARVAKRGEGSTSFSLEMARKDVRLMIESAGGPEGMVALPAIAAEMDRAIADGLGGKDFAVYAWPRGRKPTA